MVSRAPEELPDAIQKPSLSERSSDLNDRVEGAVDEVAGREQITAADSVTPGSTRNPGHTDTPDRRLVTPAVAIPTAAVAMPIDIPGAGRGKSHTVQYFRTGIPGSDDSSREYA